jgi:hypothetical protein
VKFTNTIGGMRHSRIPSRVGKKANQIASKIVKDGVSPFALGGKRLPSLGGTISVPVMRRYRALFAAIDSAFEYLGCISHERYNKLQPESVTHPR